MDPTKGQVSGTVDAQLLEIMLRLGSRWVLWLLLFLSVAAVAVALERLWFYFRVGGGRAKLERMLVTLRTKGAGPALAEIGTDRSMSAAVARACLLHADQSASAVEEHLNATLEAQRLAYERGLAFLGTLGSNAPFIGLFGTVLGIIRAFHDLAMNTTAGASVVMAGIAEALVATAIGLLVALPSVAAYNSFARHVETNFASASGVGRMILAHLKGGAALPPAPPEPTPATTKKGEAR